MSAVLGLSDKGDYDWARLRGLQYSALAKLTLYRGLSQGILAVLVAQVFVAKVGLLVMAVWFAAQAAIQWRGAKIDLSLADTDRRRITPAEFQRQASTAVLSGLVWGVGFVAFPFFGTPGDLMAMLVVVAILVLVFGTLLARVVNRLVFAWLNDAKFPGALGVSTGSE